MAAILISLYLAFMSGVLLGIYVGYSVLYDELFEKFKKEKALSHGLVDEEQEEEICVSSESNVCIDVFKRQSRSYNCLGNIGKS